MSFDPIIKDDYGYTLSLTFIDKDDDAAEDLSGYTTAQYIVLKDPSGNESEKSASFSTDGSDGVVEYTVQSGDFDETGFWKARIKVQSGSSILRSEWHTFEVLE